MTDQRQDSRGVDRNHSEGGADADPPVIYGETMRLDVLLDLQDDIAAGEDDLFFVVLHQAHELWFKLLLHELESARDHIVAGALPSATEKLERVRYVEHSLVEQLNSLTTLSVTSFDALREHLGTSSAFQSAQFREIEFLSGRKDRRYLGGRHFSPLERERLRRRFEEASLRETFEDLMVKRGTGDTLTVLRREGNSDLRSLARALLGHDEGFLEWRKRHLELVGRLVGQRAGTGGTSGLPFLRATLATKFFPSLWEIRSHLQLEHPS